MPYQVTFEERSNFISATVTGDNSRDVVPLYMTDILKECTRLDCFRVLIDERLEGPRLDEMEVFSMVAEGSMKAIGKFDAIAYVDEKMGQMADFAETVAVNRGMPVAMFDNLGDAEAWLCEQNSGSDQKHIFWKRNRLRGS